MSDYPNLEPDPLMEAVDHAVRWMRAVQPHIALPVIRGELEDAAQALLDAAASHPRVVSAEARITGGAL